MSNGLNPAFVVASLKAAQEIDPKIPDNAEPFFFSIRGEILGDYEIESGLMGSDEIEDMIESARHDVLLPKGFMVVGFYVPDESAPPTESEKWYVMLNARELPPMTEAKTPEAEPAH